MSALVVDVMTERHYRSIDRTSHDRWWQWLTDTLQRDPKRLRIRTVTLGEGCVTLTRLGDPIEVDDNDEPVAFTETYPALEPPPCWPPAGSR